MTATGLLAAATAQTGLSDLGERRASVMEGLEQFLTSVETDLEPDASTRNDVAAESIGLLTNALHLVEDRKRNPGIAAEPIERPIIIGGLGRSGTTLIQELLALHPGNRTPRWWENSFPSPPPGTAGPDDPRRAMADEQVRAFVEAAPGVLVAHPYLDDGGDATAECEMIMQMSFRSSHFFELRGLPSYLAWYWQTDHVPAYQFHREFLQQTQWQSPPRRWVLKGTRHTFHLDAVRAVYPDAVMLWLHRNPVDQFASSLALSDAVRPAKDAAERHRFAVQRLELNETGMQRSLDSPVFDDESFLCHIRFEQFIVDPVATIRHVYEKFGLDWSLEFERAMRSWLADPANRSDRYGKLRYDLAAFGIERDEVERRLAFFAERIEQIPPIPGI